MNRFFRIVRHLFCFLYSKINPIGYAKYIGVRLGANVNFYGMHPAMFSTEPWLITIGNNVHVTSGCQFVTHDGGTLVLRHKEPSLEITAPIVVGNNVYIGMRTIILPGVVIGDNVVIGAGSVVSKSIPSDTVVAGVPAKKIKDIDTYFNEIKGRSLGYGHLSAADKEMQLKKHFGVL